MIPNYATWSKALVARGYKIYQPNRRIGDTYDCLYQKRFFDKDGGTRFFINFREWSLPTPTGISFDTYVCFETDGDNGYVWATLKEMTIEASEKRAEQIWQAVGGIYYDKNLSTASTEI